MEIPDSGFSNQAKNSRKHCTIKRHRLRGYAYSPPGR